MVTQTDDCPLPLAHDRFEEAHWHLHQMMDHYHHPMTFRYSTNAFLHALKSVLDMLRIDLERHGQNDWRRQRLDELKQNDLFSAFSRGRDVVVHQGSLVESSKVEMGLFKYHKVKFAIVQDIKTDEPSHSLLARLIQINAEGGELFVDASHPYTGEQLGVSRLYFESKLDAERDVLTASDSAWRAVGQVLQDAHGLLSRSYEPGFSERDDAHDVDRVCRFLETDLNPSAAEEWDW